MMFEMLAIDYIGIRVSDLESTRQFYEKIGFDFIAGPTGPEPVAIMQHHCGVIINFILNADCSPDNNILMDMPERHAGYTHMALRVSNLFDVKSYLDGLNITITEGPIDFGGDFGSSLFIRDQDRNVIEFHQTAK